MNQIRLPKSGCIFMCGDPEFIEAVRVALEHPQGLEHTPALEQDHQEQPTLLSVVRRA
jgi:hypothetical protein